MLIYKASEIYTRPVSYNLYPKGYQVIKFYYFHSQTNLNILISLSQMVNRTWHLSCHVPDAPISKFRRTQNLLKWVSEWTRSDLQSTLLFDYWPIPLDIFFHPRKSDFISQEASHLSFWSASTVSILLEISSGWQGKRTPRQLKWVKGQNYFTTKMCSSPKQRGMCTGAGERP